MKLVVEYLSPDIGERQVRAAFSIYGAVGEIEIVPDERHPRGRNVAYITMDDDAAAVAIACMRGVHWVGEPRIWVKEA